MKLKPLLFYCLILLVFASTQYAQATIEVTHSFSTRTFYMNPNIITVNGVTGYTINETIATTGASILEVTTSATNVSLGWRVYIVDNSNVSTELTTMVSAITSRTSDGAGTQGNTWTVPQNQTLVLGWYSIKVIMYRRWNFTGDWTARATFTTNELLYTQLGNATWTIYSWIDVSGGQKVFYYYWGMPIWNSRITGIKVQNPTVYEMQLYHLQHGDFMLMITFPFTNLIGTTFYGLIMLLICVPLWNRYHSFKPILFTFLIFGGQQGLFSFFVPEIGMPIGWIFCLLGLAGLLYQVTR